MLDLLRKVFTPVPDAASVEVREEAGVRHHRVSEPDEIQRKSIGLSHFFESFPDAPHLEILDLGGICESNVNYLSRLGCRIHSFDLVPNFDRRKHSLPGRQFEPEAALEFVEEYFNFPPSHFHAIFAWDCLQHLEPEVLRLTVTRLAQVMRGGGPMLAFFHTQSRGDVVAVHRYQIENEHELLLRTRETRPLPSTFNNRGLERLFSGFESMKFFLTRDSLREVIAVR